MAVDPRRCTCVRHAWKETVCDRALGARGLPPRVGAASVRAVALALHDRMNADGGCFPSIGRVAGETGLGERTVRAAVRALERQGFLRTSVSKGRFSSRYQATFPAAAACVIDGLGLGLVLPAPGTADGLWTTLGTVFPNPGGPDVNPGGPPGFNPGSSARVSAIESSKLEAPDAALARGTGVDADSGGCRVIDFVAARRAREKPIVLSAAPSPAGAGSELPEWVLDWQNAHWPDGARPADGESVDRILEALPDTQVLGAASNDSMKEQNHASPS